MKKVLWYIASIMAILLLASSASCISSQSPIPVKGSGSLTDKTFTVSGFDAIDVSGGFDVELLQGSSEEVVISAQENLFDYITVKVEESGLLRIRLERNVIQTKGLKARISLKSISKLSVSGGGDVKTETPLEVPNLAISISGGGDLLTNLKTGELHCNMSGGGDAEINGDIASFNLNMSGGGNIQSSVHAQTISCSLSGGGNANINNRGAAKLADIDISGGGDIKLLTEADIVKCSLSGGGDATLEGSAKNLEIGVNGGGDINAGSFTAESATFNASGGSDVRIRASSQLTGNISGGGDVYYSGSPAMVNIDAKGGSTVHKE